MWNTQYYTFPHLQSQSQKSSTGGWSQRAFKEPEKSPPTTQASANIYDESTDDEAFDAQNGTSNHGNLEKATQEKEASPDELPDLPEFFTGKHFFLYGKFEASEKRSLQRYIVAYDGLVL